MDSRELNRAMERVESARSRQAVEFDKLFDSIVLRGVLFYRPTLAHSWTMAELLERGRSWSSVERRLVLGWCLTFSPVEVGGCFRELLRGGAELLPERAVGFMSEHGLNAFEVLPAVDELLGDLLPKKGIPEVGRCGRGGGPGRCTNLPPDTDGARGKFSRFLWCVLRRIGKNFSLRRGRGLSGSTRNFRKSVLWRS